MYKAELPVRAFTIKKAQSMFRYANTYRGKVNGI